MSPAAGRASALVVDPSNSQTLYAGFALGGVWKTTDAGATWAPLMDLAPTSLAASRWAPWPSTRPRPRRSTSAPASPRRTSATRGKASSSRRTAGRRSPRSAAPRSTGSPSAASSSTARPGTSTPRPSTAGSAAGRSATSTSTPPARASTDPTTAGPRSLRSSPARSPISRSTPASPRAASSSASSRRARSGPTTAARPGSPPPASPRRRAASPSPSRPPTRPSSTPVSATAPSPPSTSPRTAATPSPPCPGAPDYCKSQCYYDNAVAVDPNDEKTLYVGGSLCGVWKTSNGTDPAPTWDNVSLEGQGCSNGSNWYNGYAHPDVHAIAFDPSQPGTVFAATDGGVGPEHRRRPDLDPAQHRRRHPPALRALRRPFVAAHRLRRRPGQRHLDARLLLPDLDGPQRRRRRPVRRRPQDPEAGAGLRRLRLRLPHHGRLRRRAQHRLQHRYRRLLLRHARLRRSDGLHRAARRRPQHLGHVLRGHLPRLPDQGRRREVERRQRRSHRRALLDEVPRRALPPARRRALHPRRRPLRARHDLRRQPDGRPLRHHQRRPDLDPRGQAAAPRPLDLRPGDRPPRQQDRLRLHLWLRRRHPRHARPRLPLQRRRPDLGAPRHPRRRPRRQPPRPPRRLRSALRRHRRRRPRHHRRRPDLDDLRRRAPQRPRLRPRLPAPRRRPRRGHLRPERLVADVRPRRALRRPRHADLHRRHRRAPRPPRSPWP